MKVMVGNSVGMTISPRAYESIRVESTFHIEKDIKNDSEIEEIADKISKRLMDDLDKKIKEVYQKQNHLKKILKDV